MRRDFQKIESEAKREEKTLSSLARVGLYTDGNSNNSSFDLMKDLQDVQDIIFSKDLPYDGRVNTSATSIGAFLSNTSNIALGLEEGGSLTDRLSFDLADAGWRLATPTRSTATGSIAEEFTPLCAAPPKLAGLDT